MAFTEAERRSSKARIALDGPSGSGKTWTALLIAKLLITLSGSDRKPALIDSERDSSKKYAIKRGTEESDGNWRFLHSPLENKTPQEYSAAISEAADANVEELVIDSLSHLWLKVLELIDRGGGWPKAGKTWGPRYQAVIDQIVSYPGHVICTMRAKSGFSMEKDEKAGKTSVKKLGMEAVIREGAEFEFDLWLNLAVDGTITVSKSRFGKVAPVGEVYERSQLPQLIEALLRELDAGVEQTPFERISQAIGFAQNDEQLKAIVPQFAALEAAQREELKKVYFARKRALIEGGAS